MKKYTTTLLLAFVACIAFTSCKRDFTCTCFDQAGIATEKSTYNQITKNVAEERCDLLNKGAALNGGYCNLN
jgi:hypothetical protein